MTDKKTETLDEVISETLVEETRTEDNVELKPERPQSQLDKRDIGYQADIIHVLRTSQQHHVTLGMIADQKANIILGAFLIFVTVTQKMPDLGGNLDIPIWSMTAFFTLSALFALNVIVPRVRKKKQKTKSYNPLFFGSFTDMEQQEYVDMLSSRLTNNKEARELIMQDIYQIGQVLDKKYRNLRYSYGSLSVGIVSSAIAFGAVHLSN